MPEMCISLSETGRRSVYVSDSSPPCFSINSPADQSCPIYEVPTNNNKRAQNITVDRVSKESFLVFIPHMGLLLFEIYFPSRRLFLGMVVIGSFTTRDVFVVAPSVLRLIQRNLSILSESSQR